MTRRVDVSWRVRTIYSTPSSTWYRYGSNRYDSPPPAAAPSRVAPSFNDPKPPPAKNVATSTPRRGQ